MRGTERRMEDEKRKDGERESGGNQTGRKWSRGGVTGGQLVK